jgi:choline dehydrogenase-like flavoprotein
VDPRYLSHPLDVAILNKAVLFMQDLVTKDPLASLLKDRGRAFRPGYKHLAEDTVAAFCRASLQTEYHGIRTCAMMPRADGGVVDTRLKVYGVKNLRVVNAAVFPLMIRNNLQTSVYAVAEKAADIIKEDWNMGVARAALRVCMGTIRSTLL